MLLRRELLAALGWAALLAHWPRSRAGAAASSADGRENCSFLQDMQRGLTEAFARGETPAGASRSAICPLCGDRVTVVAR
jgi:hypothetical protein